MRKRKFLLAGALTAAACIAAPGVASAAVSNQTLTATVNPSKIVKSGAKELALELERKGYDWIKSEVAAAQ